MLGRGCTVPSVPNKRSDGKFVSDLTSACCLIVDGACAIPFVDIGEATPNTGNVQALQFTIPQPYDGTHRKVHITWA